MLSDRHYYFNKAADVIGLSDKVRGILLSPRRTIKIDIVVEAAMVRRHQGCVALGEVCCYVRPIEPPTPVPGSGTRNVHASLQT